jgi:hypothetical protein
MEDFKLNISGCRSPRRRRYNPREPEASRHIFLNWKECLCEPQDLQAGSLNIQSLAGCALRSGKQNTDKGGQPAGMRTGKSCFIHIN